MLTDFEVKEILQKTVIRRIRKKEFSQLFELTSKTSARTRAITGLSVQRLSRVAKLYGLFEILLPVFDVFHKDSETILVAVSGDRLVGEIHLVPLGKKIWRINSAAVDTKFRRHDVFRRLMGNGLRYISTRRGERVFGSFRTDIAAVEKVMCKSFGFEAFEKLLLLQFELDEIPSVNLEEDVSIREVKPTDIKQIYQICKSINPEKMRIFKMAPKDFLEPLLSRLVNKIAWSDSKRWVMEVEGKIVGYARFTYTPPQEAGEIESFYVLPSRESSKLIRLLLGKILGFLAERNIRKLVVYLNEEWRLKIEIFEHFGFKPIASYYNTAKELL